MRRSTSKPELATKNRNEKSGPKGLAKREVDNPAVTKKLVESHDTKIVKSGKSCKETVDRKTKPDRPVDDTPGNRASRKKSKTKKINDPNRHKTDENKNTVDDRPAIRKHRKKDPTKRTRQKESMKTTQRNAKTEVTAATLATNGDKDDIDTPPSRAVRKKRPRSKTRKKKEETREGETQKRKRREPRPKRNPVSGSKKLSSTSRRKKETSGSSKQNTTNSENKKRTRRKHSAKPLDEKADHHNISTPKMIDQTHAAEAS